MQLDHFFVITEASAPAAELLVRLGLVEGSSNDHPGQGTANRRFFFTNTALELIYVRDAKEAEEGPGKGLRIAKRASSPDASPFGLVLRRDGQPGSPTFEGWHYQPVYFEPGVSFLVADNSDRIEEPLCICMPDNAPKGAPQDLSAAPFTEVTELAFHVPTEGPSSVLHAMARVDGVRIQPGRPHLLEITFGNGIEGRQHDLRPRLPLMLRW